MIIENETLRQQVEEDQESIILCVDAKETLIKHVVKQMGKTWIKYKIFKRPSINRQMT